MTQANAQHSIATAVRAKRVQLDLNVESVAEAFDVAVSTVSRWENGKTPPGPRALHKIERWLADELRIAVAGGGWTLLPSAANDPVEAPAIIAPGVQELAAVTARLEAVTARLTGTTVTPSREIDKKITDPSCQYVIDEPTIASVLAQELQVRKQLRARGVPKGPTRVSTFAMSVDTKEKLKRIAEKNGESMTEILEALIDGVAKFEDAKDPTATPSE